MASLSGNSPSIGNGTGYSILFVGTAVSGGTVSGRHKCEKKCGDASVSTTCESYQTCSTSCGRDGKSPCVQCYDAREGGKAPCDTGSTLSPFGG